MFTPMQMEFDRFRREFLFSDAPTYSPKWTNEVKRKLILCTRVFNLIFRFGCIDALVRLRAETTPTRNTIEENTSTIVNARRADKIDGIVLQ